MNWISVEDRLPDHSDWVLVSDGELVDLASYDIDWWVGETRMSYADENVTHWMPLPKMPCTNTLSEEIECIQKKV